jgi:hypothetical protein
MRIVAAVLAVVACQAATVAWAVDYPISGSKIALKFSASGRRSLTFVSKSKNMPFPAVGSADNPATGTPGGVRIDLFSGTEGQVTFNIPRGINKPGWSVGTGTVGQYKYVNPTAPGGTSIAKLVLLKQGRLLKIATKHVPLELVYPQQRMGIRITMGTTRACAMFLPSTVGGDEPGKFGASNAPATALPDCEDATLENPPNACGGVPTFDVIQQRIFAAHGCNVGSCHGPFAAANLDLRPGAAYTSLVDVAADNPMANAAGKKRVEPGNAAASFLSQKLRGTIDSQGGEGSRMPLVGNPLSAIEMDLVDAWINGGAPQTGEVPGAPCLPPQEYEPAPALDPPPGGYQIVLNGPVLQPGQEQEGCMWIPVPNATDFDVGKWEFSLNPGTHHFAIFEYNRSGAPQTNVWTPNDFGCFSGTQFGNNITGSPQSPYYVDAYPAGVARRLVAGKYLGLNAHYYNTFDTMIQIKVWINAYPYSGPPPKLATTIVDIDDTFSINVPPFTEQIHPPVGQPRSRWTNTSSVNRNVIFLGGHMHFRGLRFTVWGSGGSKLYESFDWAHPNMRVFTPALVIPPGGYLDYECDYDNGVTRPVRTDSSGTPTNLVFGVSAQDAMCIVTGSYYE